MIEIEKSLVVSTAHISEDTADLLESDSFSDLVVDPYEYGYLVHIPAHLEDIENVPEDLKRLMMFASKTLNCEWLKLDQDGPEIDLDFFEIFSW